MAKRQENLEKAEEEFKKKLDMFNKEKELSKEGKDKEYAQKLMEIEARE